MATTERQRAAVLLVGAATLSGLLWRAEVEWHGWAGLLWIRYFHWAVPAGGGLFVLWCIFVARQRRALLALSLILAALPLYWLTATQLRWAFITGPAAFTLTEGGQKPLVNVMTIAAATFCMPTMPLALSGVAYLAGVSGVARRLLSSGALWIVSWPITIAIMMLTRPYEADAIHVIKTGVIIPFLFVALGLLFLPNPSSGASDQERCAARN